MASFDDKSLFTNVTSVEVLDICVYTLIEQGIQVEFKKNRKILKLSTSGVQLTFNSQMYSKHLLVVQNCLHAKVSSGKTYPSQFLQILNNVMTAYLYKKN